MRISDWSSDVCSSDLKGMTTEFLVERCARIAPGQSALVHAAAGGVGSLLVQWLKAAGVEVFAHAGSEAKADAVHALGIEGVSFCALDELAGWVRQGTGDRKSTRLNSSH